MRIRFAHLRERSTTGGWIGFAVFDAKSTTGANDALLALLTFRARTSGLKIDQSALAYMQGSRVMYYGVEVAGGLSFAQRLSAMDA